MATAVTVAGVSPDASDDGGAGEPSAHRTTRPVVVAPTTLSLPPPAPNVTATIGSMSPSGRVPSGRGRVGSDTSVREMPCAAVASVLPSGL
jgi:hypothetical protein